MGARCTFAHSVQTSYLICPSDLDSGGSGVCVGDDPSADRAGRREEESMTSAFLPPYPPPPPPAADSHRPALSKFGFYSAQRRTRYRSLVPLKAAIVSSCEEADLLLNHRKNNLLNMRHFSLTVLCKHTRGNANISRLRRRFVC